MNKIYTKKGDKGETSLLGGKLVPKYYPRVEAYGNIDELNSFIGLLQSTIEDKGLSEKLIKVQTHLYHMASLIACDSCEQQLKLVQIKDDDIKFLENEIDIMTKAMPELTSFIVPGGNAPVSYSHICRCVCRRAERTVIILSEKTKVDNQIIVYLNRLSDYFFTLARHLTYKSGLEEIKYKDLDKD